MLSSDMALFDRIKDIFAPGPANAPEAAQDRADRLMLATSVLLLETACIDDEFTDSERESIVRSLQTRFSLSDEDARDLMEAAAQSREKSIDLWQFTNQINQACNTEEKIQIIEEVWRVVFADRAIDAHETHLARQLAKLLNLTHRHMIDAKLKILKEVRGA